MKQAKMWRFVFCFISGIVSWWLCVNITNAILLYISYKHDQKLVVRIYEKYIDYNKDLAAQDSFIENKLTPEN